MSKVLNFPGTVPGTVAKENKDGEVEIAVEMDEVDHVTKCLEAFLAERGELDIILNIAIDTNGQIRWGSSSRNLLEILWMCEAMKRIAMDRTLGITDSYNED